MSKHAAPQNMSSIHVSIFFVMCVNLNGCC